MEHIHHASCVSILDKGLLITGASGAGKSSLAFELMAFGADLVADDRTVLTPVKQTLMAAPHPEIAGLIEARGLGVLQAHNRAHVEIHAILDLDVVETERIPPARTLTLLGCEIDLLYRVQNVPFAAVLWHYMRNERNR